MENNKAIAYCRCSTDLQEMSIPDQKKALEEYAKKNGLQIVKYFEDEGVSGRYAEERPDFMQMIEYVKHYSDIKYVLCYDVSRWGRFIDPQEATYWEILIKKHGKQVLYVTGGFRNDGNIGDNVLKLVKNSEASDFAMNLSKTSFRGHKTWAEKGYFVGGRAKFGYDRALYDEDGRFVKTLKKGEHKATKTQHVKLKVNPEESRIVKMVFDMRIRERLGLRSIANKLNQKGLVSPKGGKWSSSTLWYMLRDEVYTGTMIYNKQKVDNLHERDKGWGRFKPRSEWVICENAHEAIISKEEFSKVFIDKDKGYKKEKGIKGKGRTHRIPYLLSSGLIKCKSCGHSYQGHTNRSYGNENCYYICGGYQMKGNSVCNLWYVPRDPAELYAIEGIRKRINTPEWRENIEKHLKKIIENRYSASSGELGQIEREIQEVEKRIGNLTEAIEQGLDRVVAIDRIKALQIRRQTLYNRQEALSRQAGDKKDFEAIMSKIMGYMNDFEDVVKSSSLGQKRDLIDRFMLPVEVDTKQKKLYYRFLKVPMIKQVAKVSEKFGINSPHHFP